MATGALDSNGIWQYGEDDSEPTFSALLNKLGSSTSTTVTRLEEMGGITSTQAATARDNLRVGLVPLSPSSVVIATGTGSANALGKVSFTGATAVSLNGVFTSEYSNYRIIYRNSTRTNNTFDYLRLRGSGTDVSSATYDWVKVFANTGSGPSRSQGAPVAQVEIGYAVTNDRSSATIEFFNPATAEQTWGNWQFGNYAGSIEGGIGSFRNYNNTAYDGFTLFPSGGNFTGYIQVFGYND